MARTPYTETQGQTGATPDIAVRAEGHEIITLPNADFIRNAEILRDGQDLVLEGPDGSAIVIEGYFNASPAPLLQAPGGEALTPELVESFVRHEGPARYAEVSAASDVSPVGVAQEVSGHATVTRADGSVEQIAIGTKIYEGDIIETTVDGAVNIVFIDQTSFAVSQNAKLAIDEYVFDPASESGTSNFSVLRGLFVFTSGLIGREDPDDVTIDTPVGSIGIRGTIIAGNMVTGEITVMEGAIVLRGLNGTEVTLAEQFETGRFDAASGGVIHVGMTAVNTFESTFSSIRSVTPGFFSSFESGDDAPDTQDQQTPDGTNESPAQTETREAAPEQSPEQLEAAPETADPAAPAETQPEAPQLPATDPFFDNRSDAGFEQHTEAQVAMAASTGNSGTGSASSLSQTSPSSGSESSGSSSGSSSQQEITTTPLPPPPPAPTGTTAPTLLDLRTIGGANGFFLAGAAGEHLGFALAPLGDHDNDGAIDFMVAGNVANTGLLHVYAYSAGAIFQTGTPSVGANNTSTPDIAYVGDFNGDGIFDHMTGTPSTDTFGADAGSVSIQGGGSFMGPNVGDNLGQSVAGIGDINGDGFSDVIAGSPKFGANDFGNAYVVFGTSTPNLIDIGDTGGFYGTAFNGTPDFEEMGFGYAIDGSIITNGEFGVNVSGAGDFNNDGYADFMATEFTGPGTGGVYMFMGSFAGTFSNPTGAAIQFGNIGTDGEDVPVKQMGDMNGDGVSDIAIANTLDDKIYVLFGGGATDTNVNDGINAGSGFTVLNTGPGAIDGGGFAGDFNGDGFDDGAIVVRDGNRADIFVIYGHNGMPPVVDMQALFTDPSKAFHMVYNIGSGSPFEFNIATAGDVNGDGFDDLLIGTPQAGSGAGGFALVYGRNTLRMGADGTQTHIAHNTSPDNKVFANAANQHLVGDATNNELHDKLGTQTFGNANISMRGGAGDDVLILNNLSNTADTRNAANLGNIDGGAGRDVLRFNGDNDTLDFAGVGSEGLSGIEEIAMMGNSQTLKLGIDDIFRLLQESEDGMLKISSLGANPTGNRLFIENNGNATDLPTDPMLIDSDLRSYLQNVMGQTVTMGSSGGYTVYQFGGSFNNAYTLAVQTVLLDSTDPSQVV